MTPLYCAALSLNKKQTKKKKKQQQLEWGALGGVMARIRCFHHCSLGSIPRLGTEIPH